MAFHFSLQSLLHYRKSVERREELLLQAANSKVAQLRFQINRLDEFLKRCHALRREELQCGTYGAELQFELLSESALHTSRQGLLRELSQLETLRDQRRSAFRKAKAEREAVETIRDHQSSLYKEQQDRRAQRELDDLFLMRREFLRRG